MVHIGIYSVKTQFRDQAVGLIYAEPFLRPAGLYCQFHL